MHINDSNRRRGPRRRGLPASALLVSLLALALTTGLTTNASAQQSAPPRFGSADVARLEAQLAGVGIGVYVTGKAVPLRPIVGRDSPVRLTVDQLRSAALGVWSHTGLSGAALDGLALPTRLTPKLRIPVGAFVTGWANNATTPSAALARRLVGPADWKHYKTIVFPEAVLFLFASDLLTHIEPPIRKTSMVTRGAVAANITALRPCSAIQGFVLGAIENVFKAVGHIHIDTTPLTAIPLIGKIIAGAVDAVITGANTVIDVTHTIVIEGYRLSLGYVTQLLAVAAGTINTIAEIANIVLPWKIRLVPEAQHTAKGIGVGIPGVIILTASTPAGGIEWPAWLSDCADVFHLTLPSFAPRDATVGWKIDDPEGLITPTEPPTHLDKTGQARFEFATTTETPQQARGASTLGVTRVTATVERHDLKQLADRLAKALIPPVIAKVDVIEGVLRSKLSEAIGAATRKLEALRDLETTAQIDVTYHTPNDRPPLGPYVVTVPWTNGNPLPLLQLYSCHSLAGPWRGSFDYAPPAPGRQPIPVSVALDRSYNGRFTGQSTATRPTSGGLGDTITETNSWSVPVHVTVGPDPTMSFPGARVRGVEVIHPAETTVDSGSVSLPGLSDKTVSIQAKPVPSCG